MTPLFDYKNKFQEFENVKSILQYGDFSTCESPCISVIMPIYQSPQFFKDALFSVVNQKCDFLYEIIVVDNTPFDGNKSDTLQFIEDLALSNLFYYRNEKNIGMCGNWNRGIKLSRSNYVTFCHDDDMLAPFCLSTLWRIHDKFPSKAVFSAHKDINEMVHYPIGSSEESQKNINCYKYDKFDILMECPSNGVGCLFKKELLIDLGGYNNEYFPALDYALYIKYSFEYGSVFCCNLLYYYRKSTNNTSFKIYDQYMPKMNFLWESMLKKMRFDNYVGNRVIKTLSKVLTISIEKEWKKKNPSKNLNYFDKLLYFCFLKRRLYKTFTLR